MRALKIRNHARSHARSDKLDPSVFTPEKFEAFARRYGVDTVIFDPAKDPHPWDFFLTHPTKSMVYNRLMSSEVGQPNPVIIFDFKNPSTNPESILDVPLNATGGTMSLDL